MESPLTSGIGLVLKVQTGFAFPKGNDSACEAKNANEIKKKSKVKDENVEKILNAHEARGEGEAE